jgi:hypothetical protein
MRLLDYVHALEAALGIEKPQPESVEQPVDTEEEE